ncbi:unnamed protein product [Bursaphelenchus xylophilus]|uniref:(pine wood nematode) hypothetical protein n=1 Tax=Bursaphelenchus xylophilus TaxID=6326 RepID=A0A1I7RS53_BURXY|nr:unnamed protein product [Bursaphelenchus xylophilus]CAG9123205.1 unnamed protein product [Bursaphelenchus xylophilus]
MLGRGNGFVLFLLLFVSSLLGSIFFLFPFVPLAFFAPRLWRFVADRFVGYWLTFPASIVFFLFGVKIRVTGDLIRRDEPAIIIMNHRTRLDWLFFWNALYKMDPWLLTTEKISLKAELNKIPGAGWAMGCGSYIFLNRNYSKDHRVLETMIKYYKDSSYKYQLLLFPEGTDRGIRATDLSHKYADENGLPRYDYILHPRTTGFNFILKEMKKRDYIKYVYDVTVGYPKGIVNSEVELLRTGKVPGEVHFDIRRYNVEEVIGKEEHHPSNWLKNIWIEKEEKLRKFYEEDGQFEPSGEDSAIWPVESFSIGYYVAFSIWTLLSIFWIYWIYASFYVKIYVLVAVLFFSFAHKSKGGVEFLFLEWFYGSHLFLA